MVTGDSVHPGEGGRNANLAAEFRRAITTGEIAAHSTSLQQSG